jgi:hypothetical protein
VADKKISALTASTTPLAGTEVLPIVQSGATVKVSVANLTAGRTPQVAGLLVGDNTSASPAVAEYRTNTTGYYVGIDGPAGSNTGIPNAYYVLGVGNYPISLWTNVNERVRIEGGGDVNIKTGNLVIGTSGKGIDFSADSSAAGMTSELLDDYEEGTWTPNQGAALVVGGSYSSSGTYTKIGRLVTVTAIQSGSTSIETGSSNIIFSNLPFNVGAFSRFSGVTSMQFSAVAGAVAVGGTGNVYSAGALSGGDTIITTLSYEV